jgi:hypothetical protein
MQKIRHATCRAAQPTAEKLGAGDGAVIMRAVMELGAFAASVLGGGLAGGCVNVLHNRIVRWRDLRTRFYPKVSDIYSAYVIRMETPQGRYWVTIVGQEPSNEDREFVDRRAGFLLDLVQFNELREGRVLRKALLDNAMKGDHTPGIMTKHDLSPELQLINTCLRKLHKRLKL